MFIQIGSFKSCEHVLLAKLEPFCDRVHNPAPILDVVNRVMGSHFEFARVAHDNLPVVHGNLGHDFVTFRREATPSAFRCHIWLARELGRRAP